MNDVFLRHLDGHRFVARRIRRCASGKMLDPHYLHWARHGDALHLHDYMDAEKERMHIGAYFKGILDEYDILVTPTTPMIAFAAGVDMPNDERGRPMTEIWTPFTLPANLARLPAVSLPLGLTVEGLPVGIQIMAGYLKDALALQAAKKLEREISFQGWLALRPKLAGIQRGLRPADSRRVREGPELNSASASSVRSNICRISAFSIASTAGRITLRASDCFP